MTKCGMIAIVGRPNVGKSTLLNKLIGKKISIVSHKPQTTRHRILGVKTIDDIQYVYVDTPGLHHDAKNLMNRVMNKKVGTTMQEVDLILFLVDSHHWFPEDRSTLELIQKKAPETPVILVINKVDQFHNKAQALPVIDFLKTKHPFAEIVPLSALKNENVAALEKVIAQHLPDGEFFFPEDYLTDRSQYFLLAEQIREKIFKLLEEEMPYASTVVINNIEKIDSVTSRGQAKTVMHIDATIYVEREGQKNIVISKLKEVGTRARQDMELMLGMQVFLRQWVKVKSDWSDNASLLQEFGYEP